MPSVPLKRAASSQPPPLTKEKDEQITYKITRCQSGHTGSVYVDLARHDYVWGILYPKTNRAYSLVVVVGILAAADFGWPVCGCLVVGGILLGAQQQIIKRRTHHGHGRPFYTQ